MAVMTTVFLIMLVCSMTGCKKSPVIEQIIYDQNAKDVDRSAEALIKYVENNELPDISLPPVEKRTDTPKKDKEVKAPAAEGTQKNPAAAPKTQPNDENAPTESGKTPEPAEPDSDTEGETPSGGPDTAGPSDDPDSREIIDANGEKVALPAKVNSVVAAGDAAVIVQMLGGKGILLGTSQNIASNALGQSVFASQDIAEAKQLWSGSGSSPMSSANFNSLLSMKPEAVVYISGGSSFSSAQLKTLKDNKIATVALPKLNTFDNIVDAVKIAGGMIADRSAEPGGVNAKTLADEYERYSKTLLSSVQSKAGGRYTWNGIDFNNDASINGVKRYTGQTTKNGKYTLFVSGWDTSANFTLTGNGATLVSETGVAIAPRGYSLSPLSYYMSVAGVLNNGARFTEKSNDYLAAIPVNLNTNTPAISGSTLKMYSDKAENMLRVWGGDDTLDVGLGESGKNFNSIVVDSAATKNRITGSGALWKSYGKNTVDNMTDYGFVTNAGGSDMLIISYIRGDYDIYVNPCGISSWSEGSPESVLEAIWTSWRINGASSEAEVKKEIRDFYKKFYRYDLSDAQVNKILAGN